MHEYVSMPSLIDTLVDDKPGETWDDFEPPSFRVIEDNLKRDLEELLNCAVLHRREDMEGAALESTVVRFGLEDVYRVNPADRSHRERLRRDIERKIAVFEPRLSAVRVFEIEQAGSDGFRLEYRVEGLLRLDPKPVPISLSAQLNAVRRGMGIVKLVTGG